MRKSLIIAILFLVGCTNLEDNYKFENSGELDLNNYKVVEKTVIEPVELEIKKCDGVNITTDCELEGIKYDIYKYHPAVAEKSHHKTITNYKKEIVGYCTLCKDGTYSPSCATGRGACSHMVV